MTDPTTLAWIIATITWSVGGLAIGFCLGYLVREVHELREELMDEQDDHRGHHEREDAREKGLEPPERAERRSGVDRRHPHGLGRVGGVLGIVIVALAIGSVSLTAASNVRQSDFNECQRTYNARTLEALAARAEAASQDRQAITDLIRTTAKIQLDAKGVPLSDQSATDALRERSAQALQTYLDTVEAADRIRARNPVPQAPKCSLDQPRISPPPR